MRAMFEVAEGYEHLPTAGLTIEMHKGFAIQTAGEDGEPMVRLRVGPNDAGSILRYLRMAFPQAEANVVGLRCQVCNSLATVNLYLLGAESTGHWCDSCVPPERLAEHEANKRRYPQDAVATLEAVSYYLRSSYGYKPEEIAEMLRTHPYTIAVAANREMTVEAVAVDLHRRFAEPSARAILEQAAMEKGNPIAGQAPK